MFFVLLWFGLHIHFSIVGPDNDKKIKYQSHFFVLSVFVQSKPIVSVKLMYALTLADSLHICALIAGTSGFNPVRPIQLKSKTLTAGNPGR
jgi:hypothetical protein